MSDMAPPPQFAMFIDRVGYPIYLEPLKLTHDYRFQADRTGMPEISFEVKFKDADGNLIRDEKKKPVKQVFPDPNASAWVRHRQELLARQLWQDMPPPPPGPRQLGRETVKVWAPVPGHFKSFILESVDKAMVNERHMSPSEWSLLLAGSYARYLCRTKDAARVEITRQTFPLIPPIPFAGQQRQGFDPDNHNFGELPR
jgi:hypothetical protein